MANDDTLIIPRWAKLVSTAFALLVLGAVAFAYFEPVQVLPRIRLAPGYALIDQDGEPFNSETARGQITIYNFAPSDCTTCDRMDGTMSEVRDRLVGDPRLADIKVGLVTIALDPVGPAELAAAAERSGADGRQWRWIGGEAAIVENVVGSGFRRWFETADDGTIRFDPAFVITDGNGVVRGDYRYQTLSSDADKLVSHIEILADEIRHSKGAAAVAYEAAHLFLCYP